MRRKDFLKQSTLAGISYVTIPSWAWSEIDNFNLVGNGINFAKPLINNFSINDGSIYLREDQSNHGILEVILSEPKDVDVMIYSENGFTQLEKPRLSFTAQNYNIPQTVKVFGRMNKLKGVKYDKIIVKTKSNTTSKIVRVVDATISPEIYNIEPLDRIHWDVPEDMDLLRKNTIDWIWGTGYGKGDGALPIDKQPSSVQDHINDEYLDTGNITGIAEQKKLIVDLGDSPGCYLYLLIPEKPNGNFIYHPMGHGSKWEVHAAAGYNITIQRFIDEGYYVITNYMIGFGPNPQLGKLTNDNHINSPNPHNLMASLESSDPYFNPVRYFLEPYIVGINYMVSNYKPDKIYMTGLSGGGWATIWIAAMDLRVKKSFNVAGNYPEWIRDVYERMVDDDYEQGHDDPRVDGRNTTQFIIDQYERVGMLDLYCMAAQGRSHYQWNNIHDSCCFFGYYNTVYKEELKKKLDFGRIGAFDAFLYDVPNQHCYSREVVDQIIELIKNG